MKRYQALILGAVISTGSFVLGMNSVIRVHNVEGPFVVKPMFAEELDEYESKLVQGVIDSYVMVVDKKIEYQQEELDLRDSDILPTIKSANRTLIQIAERRVWLSCSRYEMYDDRVEIDDLQDGSEDRIKVQMVHNICEGMGVKL